MVQKIGPATLPESARTQARIERSLFLRSSRPIRRDGSVIAMVASHCVDPAPLQKIAELSLACCLALSLAWRHA